MEKNTIILSKFGLVELSGEPFCYIQKFHEKEDAQKAFMLELADLNGILVPTDEEIPTDVWKDIRERYEAYAEAGEYVDKNIDYILRIFKAHDTLAEKYKDFKEGHVYDVSSEVEKDSILLTLKNYR